MNPRALPPPMAGNNADTKTSRIVVLGNGGVLTPKQRAETEHAIFLHQQNARTALGGFLSRDTKLSDGSRVRIVSNSGQIAAAVWPIPIPGGTTPLEDLFMAAPVRDGVGLLPTKPSRYWKYAGATVPPTTLKKSREVTDQPTIFQHPGNLTWFNPALLVKGKPLTLSWYGRSTRYGRLNYYGRQFNYVGGGNAYESLYGTTQANYRTNWTNAFKPAVWMNGVKRDVYKLVADVVTPVKVISAAMKSVEGEGVYLYVLTVDTKLAIYRGLVPDPYSPNDIEVELVYTTTFEVDNSGSATTHWESLMQPLYFNASCTKLAGLVSVKGNSAVNPDAAASHPSVSALTRATLMEVDLVALSTAYSVAHNANERVISTLTHTGVMTTSEAATVIYTDKITEYSAVDYKVDQLVIALSEMSYTFRIESTGSWTQIEHHRLMDKYVTVSYRIVRVHDSAVLASLTGKEAHVGTFYAHATAPGIGATGSIGDGYREENIDEEILRAASIEGGDLRHDYVVIGEIVEVGDSHYSDTLIQNGTDAWHPGHRDDSVPFSFGGMLRNTFSASLKRHDALRFSVWRNNSLVDSSSAVLGVVGTLMNHSVYGFYTGIYTTPPEADSFSTMQLFHWNLTANYIASSGNTVILGAFEARSSTFFGGTPHYSCGRPYVNVSAANNAGDTFFYEVESGWQGGINPMPSDPHAAFILDGALAPIDEKTFFVDNPTGMVGLGGAVFVDRVPLKEEQL